MQTLVEFVRFTKGWEYLTAVAFIVMFLSFWYLFSREWMLKVEKPIPRITSVPLRRPLITFRRGGQFVSSGTFLNLKSWEFVVIPRPFGYLPGTEESRYIGVRPGLAIVLGPLLGLLFVIMLPLVGIGLIVVSLSLRLYRQLVGTAKVARRKGDSATAPVHRR